VSKSSLIIVVAVVPGVKICADVASFHNSYEKIEGAISAVRKTAVKAAVARLLQGLPEEDKKDILGGVKV